MRAGEFLVGERLDRDRVLGAAALAEGFELKGDEGREVLRLAAMTDGSGRTMQRISSGLDDSCQSILDPLLRPMRLVIAAGMVI